MKRRSRGNLFTSVYVPPVRFNTWSWTAPNYLTADFGYLYPCLVLEANPGEIFRFSLESFVRTQPLACPAFMQADVTYHYFFVPNRLTYEDWSNFIVRGDDGNTIYDKPYVTAANFVDSDYNTFGVYEMYPSSLMDYLNFPTLDSGDTLPVAGSNSKIDLMPFNAYSLIYNEYYRDENLIPEVFIMDQSGQSNNLSDYSDYLDDLVNNEGYLAGAAKYFACPWHIRRRAWRKDYFTSALPELQKGPEVSFASSSGLARVFAHTSDTNPMSSTQPWFLSVRANSASDLNNGFLLGFPNTSNAVNFDQDNPSSHFHSSTNPDWQKNVNLLVDGSSLQQTVMTISDFYQGLALNQWFMLNNRTGSSRYTEYLLGHFGVHDRDSRLQRPEYIGGFSHSIQISEVEQTSGTTTDSPQGNLAGKGLGFAHNSPLSYRIPEFGFVMAIMSIRPHAVYSHGMPRMYQRWDSFDYFDPLFDHLPEQAIKSSELYYDWGYVPFSDDDVDFGYIPRYAEQRCLLGQSHGDFRGDLAYWIGERQMSSAPTLDANFVEVQAYEQGLNSMFAYEGTGQAPSSHFIVSILHHIQCLRPMSKYATPRISR